MIVNIKIKNYRSYKDEINFSLEANASDLKPNNVFEAMKNLRLVKSAIIYGANASGKSNIIRAIFQISKLVVSKPKVDEKIDLYDPFIFDEATKNNPCEFEITFIGKGQTKFIYKIVVHQKIILEEHLVYFPKGKITKIYNRESYDESKIVQKGILGDSFGKKEINIFANQLILSKFGDDEPHELLTEIFQYFGSINIINATNEKHKEFYLKKVSEDLYNDEELKWRLGRLIKAADTKINDINVFKSENNPKKSSTKKMEIQNPFNIYGVHDLYFNDKIVGSENLPFDDESTGTQSLYVLGGKILRTINNGGILFVDELDTSLHPFITKMILMIFQSPTINNKNAQLIFTTHDVSLLDRDLIRRDQVWIADKNDQGETDLYSLQDFEGLREDTPFEKWYLAGKFGGLPQIKSIDSLFEK